MAELKMPEINYVIVAGNLTKDPIFRQTTNSTPVVNFSIASNRKYKDSSNQWQEDVCYVGIVAWNKLAESCRDRLKKGSAVLVDGELQSRTWKSELSGIVPPEVIATTRASRLPSTTSVTRSHVRRALSSANSSDG